MALGTAAAIALGGGALLGAIGGGIKKGPDYTSIGVDPRSSQYANDALMRFQQYAAAGPGQQDVTAATEAGRGFASTLQGFANNGLFNMQQGRALAEQQFAGQRTALGQTFQDQLAQANRQAAISGRGGNDPILKARLAVEQSRQSAQLNADQQAAAVNLGRQSSLDTIGLLSQRYGALQGLSQQAFGNQQNLFGMASQQRGLDLQQRGQDIQQSLGAAQYEASRGGGLQGALTGGISGLSAGITAAGGLQALFGGTTDDADTTAGGLSMPQFGSSLMNSTPSLLASSMASRSPAAQVFTPTVAYPQGAGPQLPQGGLGAYWGTNAGDSYAPFVMSPQIRSLMNGPAIDVRSAVLGR